MGITALLLLPDISFFTFQCFLCAICHYLVFSFSFSLTIIIQGRKCSTDWEFIQNELRETFGLATSAEDQEPGCLQDPAWQSPSWSLCKSFKVKYFFRHTAKSSVGGQFLWIKERVNCTNTDSPTCSYYCPSRYFLQVYPHHSYNTGDHELKYFVITSMHSMALKTSQVGKSCVHYMSWSRQNLTWMRAFSQHDWNKGLFFFFFLISSSCKLACLQTSHKPVPNNN